MQPMLWRRLALPLLAVLIAACSRVSVSMPPDSAAPLDVLHAYVEALASGDCDTARALATTDFGDAGMCGHITTYGIIGTPSGEWAGHEEYELTIATRGLDVTVADGRHTWWYTLAQQPEGAWRVSGGGSGP